MWNDYGIDWDGPTSLDDDTTTTVTVTELPEVLNDDEKAILETHIQELSNGDSVPTEECMRSSYTLAKVFIYEAANSS